MNRPFKVISFPFRSVLLFFIAIDLCLILIHSLGWVSFRFGWTVELPRLWRISEDRALPEDFNYLKWALISVSLIIIAIRDRWVIPFVWALVFLMILADDSLQIHETIGWHIGERLGLDVRFHLKPPEQGELFVFAVMGLSVVFLVGFSLTKAGASSRRLSTLYSLIIVALAFFGVVLDVIHQGIVNFADVNPSAAFFKHLFALLEDGGEMLVASFAVAFTLAPPAVLSRAPPAPGGFARPDRRAT